MVDGFYVFGLGEGRFGIGFGIVLGEFWLDFMVEFWLYFLCYGGRDVCFSWCWFGIIFFWFL